MPESRLKMRCFIQLSSSHDTIDVSITEGTRVSSDDNIFIASSYWKFIDLPSIIWPAAQLGSARSLGFAVASETSGRKRKVHSLLAR